MWSPHTHISGTRQKQFSHGILDEVTKVSTFVCNPENEGVCTSHRGYGGTALYVFMREYNDLYALILSLAQVFHFFQQFPSI